MDDELPASTRVGRVALRVGDLESAVDFYERVVGLRVHERADGRAVLGADGPLLVLEAAPDLPERGRAEAGLYHTAFRVPSREALGDALARVEREWNLTGASDHRVSEALYLDDPAGNGVEIYRDRPREDWPTTASGRVRMDTLALDLDELRTLASGAAYAPDGTDVGHVHLEVTDLARAREFYVDALGLRVRQALDGSALFVAAGDYHHHVGLNTWNRRSAPAAGRGLHWFELRAPRSALEDARRRFAAADHEVEPLDDGFEVTDGDGLAVRLRPVD